MRAIITIAVLLSVMCPDVRAQISCAGHEAKWSWFINDYFVYMWPKLSNCNQWGAQVVTDDSRPREFDTSAAGIIDDMYTMPGVFRLYFDDYDTSEGGVIHLKFYSDSDYVWGGAGVTQGLEYNEYGAITAPMHCRIKTSSYLAGSGENNTLVAHEIGHAMGMNDTNSQGDVMNGAVANQGMSLGTSANAYACVYSSATVVACVEKGYSELVDVDVQSNGAQSIVRVELTEDSDCTEIIAEVAANGRGPYTYLALPDFVWVA